MIIGVDKYLKFKNLKFKVDYFGKNNTRSLELSCLLVLVIEVKLDQKWIRTRGEVYP